MRLRDLPLLKRFGVRRRRERLLRDYFLISVLLIGGGLITSGLVEIYYRYQESQEQLALLQKEIAGGAAFKIEQFVQEIHNILKGATKSRDIAPKGLTPEFRFELEKLLIIAPAVTEALALDENGTIQVQASRLRTVLPDAKKDLSGSPSFRQARQGKSYFGQVYFVRGSEPYMTIAVPIERFAGDVIGVLQAEVNLKIHRRCGVEHPRGESRTCLRHQPRRRVNRSPGYQFGAAAAKRSAPRAGQDRVSSSSWRSCP